MSACRICGSNPCTNPTFCAACRRADAMLAAERRAGRQLESPSVLRIWRLFDADVSFERFWNEINDPRNRPTPRAVIEAVMYCVRERGLAALKEPANVERLSRCDAAARAQIDQRIDKLTSAQTRMNTQSRMRAQSR